MKKQLNKIVKVLDKNSSTILAWSSIVCTCSAVFAGIFGTKKAIEIIQAAEKKKGAPLTKKEKIKAVWTCYIWAFVLTGGSIAATLTNDIRVKKHIATLTSTLGATTATYEALKNEVKDILGEEKYEEIREKISEDRTKEVAKEPVPEDLKEHDGLMPCKDLQTGKWFRTSRVLIDDAKLKATKTFISSMWVPISDIYYDMHVPASEIGEMLYHHGFNNYPNILVGSGEFEDGTKYLTIDYDYEERASTYGDR